MYFDRQRHRTLVVAEYFDGIRSYVVGRCFVRGEVAGEETSGAVGESTSDGCELRLSGMVDNCVRIEVVFDLE